MVSVLALLLLLGIQESQHQDPAYARQDVTVRTSNYRVLEAVVVRVRLSVVWCDRYCIALSGRVLVCADGESHSVLAHILIEVY
jgi:hypothetical protein